MFARSGGTNPGRDGCRVPMPWSGDAPPFGFSPEGTTAEPWLPQPASWRGFTAAVQSGAADSMLEFYRRALRIRREHPALGDGTMTWLDAPAAVLAFRREPAAGESSPFACVVNLSDIAVTLPAHRSVLLASGALVDGLLPCDTAVWLELG